MIYPLHMIYDELQRPHLAKLALNDLCIFYKRIKPNTEKKRECRKIHYGKSFVENQYNYAERKLRAHPRKLRWHTARKPFSPYTHFQYNRTFYINKIQIYIPNTQSGVFAETVIMYMCVVRARVLLLELLA